MDRNEDTNEKVREDEGNEGSVPEVGALPPVPRWWSCNDDGGVWNASVAAARLGNPEKSNVNADDGADGGRDMIDDGDIRHRQENWTNWMFWKWKL